VVHGSVVSFTFALPETHVDTLVERLSESGHGQLVWLDAKLPE
jgi:hypothetical protein